VPFVWLDVLKAVAAALTARALVSLPLGLLARRGEATDVRDRVAAQPQVDAAAFVLAHEVGDVPSR